MLLSLSGAEYVSAILFSLGLVAFLGGWILWRISRSNQDDREALDLDKYGIASLFSVGSGAFLVLVFLFSINVLSVFSPHAHSTVINTLPDKAASSEGTARRPEPKKPARALSNSQNSSGETIKFLVLAALMIAIFSSFMVFNSITLKETRNLRKKTRKEFKKHEKKIKIFKQEERRFKRRLDILVDIQRVDEADAAKQISLRYLLDLYKDPTSVRKSSDLGLDILNDEDRGQVRQHMNRQDWEYVRYLAEAFTSNNDALQNDIRTATQALYNNYRPIG